MPKTQTKPSVCANCGYRFKDENNFCPSCGQKNHELKIPFKRLVVEVAENTLDIDSKAFKTIKYLLFKPGFLSSEFNMGKRVRYIPPIRLYLLISFIFFFLMNISSGPKSTNNSLNGQQNQKTKAGTHISFKSISTDDLVGLTKTQVDSLMRAKEIPETNFNKWVVYQLHKIAVNGMGQFRQLLMKNISYMMFVLMPVLGVLIYLFNRKRINYYLESLVISIHFHSFVFLFFTIIFLIELLINQSLIYLLWIVAPPVYMVLMFKSYFRQKILITITKTFFVNVFYSISLIVLFLMTIAVSVALV